MYPNLRAEMARKKVTLKMIAKELNITQATMCAKLATEDRLKVHEMKTIQEKFFPECEFSYLIEQPEKGE